MVHCFKSDGINEFLFAYRNTRVSVFPVRRETKKLFPLFCSRTKESARWGWGGGALYADNEAPLGVSDAGQVTISLSAVRG